MIAVLHLAELIIIIICLIICIKSYAKLKSDIDKISAKNCEQDNKKNRV